MEAYSRTFRVSGLPIGVTPDEAGKIIDDFFGDSHWRKIGTKVHSLGLDPLAMSSREDITIATITFGKRVPDQLEKTSSYYAQATVSFRKKPIDVSLTIDSEFIGFTPLNIVDEESAAINCITISGLGGHPFGSWKQRGGSFMWLRDSSDWRTKNVRVLLYGYHSPMVKSDSFQNIDDIGKELGNALLSLRELEMEVCIRYVIQHPHPLHYGVNNQS